MGDGIAELEKIVASAPGPVRLLVRDLRGADAAGLSVLHRLDREGTTLDGLSPYLRLMLDRASDHVSAPALSATRSETPVRSDNT